MTDFGTATLKQQLDYMLYKIFNHQVDITFSSNCSLSQSIIPVLVCMFFACKTVS